MGNNLMNTVLISVIIPVYKVEQYLEKCIESVCSQTYENLEIILVDDGSPDSCPQICDKWERKDSRIRVIHKKNGGLSDARNAGLKVASGEYIGFVDSDDYIAPEMYATLINSLIKADADVAVCNPEHIDMDGIILPQDSPIRNEVLTPDDVLAKLAYKNSFYYVVAWNKLYSKSVFSDICFPFGKVHEDEFIFHKILYKCDRIVTITDKLYFYRERDGSIMKREWSIERLDRIEALYERWLFYKSESLDKYIPELIKQMESDFGGMRGKIRVKGRAQHKRIREIDKMFRECILSLKENRNLKSYILCHAPSVYYWFGFIRRRLRRAAEFAVYALKVRKADYILINTPTHGNLGDQAIVLAEKQLMKEFLPGKRGCELTADEIRNAEKWYAYVTPAKLKLFVHGGGYLGILWPDEEKRFRRILQNFKRNKVIVFPQTITFRMDTESEKAYLGQSQEIYSAHPDLTIIVREKMSFAFAKEFFPSVKSVLAPDVVTILRAASSSERPHAREGVLFCMRNDIEKSISQDILDSMFQAVKMRHAEETISFTDTVLDYPVLPEEREKEV